MESFKFYLIALLIAALAVVGCGGNSDPDDDGNDTGGDEGDGGDGDGGDEELIVDRSECIGNEHLTCAGLADPMDCVANFELGTTQAGFDGVFTSTGWYAYNDKTEGGVMVPLKNNYDSEPATKVKSCDSLNDWVLHFAGDGFTEWGAGLGMDWGGPLNPNCDVEGALDCWELYMDDDKILLADLEAAPECDSPEKLDCAVTGKNPKNTRDLSDYVGIGFWVLRTEEDTASLIQVNFPIPDTTRFLGECSEDDGEASTQCFNDFAASVRLAPNEVGRWVYKEIMFADLAINLYWGLQLDIESFPSNESVGLKFQVAQNQAFDFYLDDIILLR